MGKTRDLLKKIRDTRRTFHAKMSTIKDRNGMDLREAEDIRRSGKNTWKNHTKKYLHDPDNHNDVITHPESDILKHKVKWALEAPLQTKLVEVMEFQLRYFKS